MYTHFDLEFFFWITLFIALSIPCSVILGSLLFRIIVYIKGRNPRTISVKWKNMINDNHPELDPLKLSPRQQRDGDAGFDLQCLLPNCEIFPNEIVKIPTGISVEIPDGYVGIIYGRSGHAIKGLWPFTGVIDSGYRGEISMILKNISDRPQKIPLYSRCGQIVFQKILEANLEESSELSESERGYRGFGSTGQ